MRTIRELLGCDEKVWVYLNSEETWNEFARMAATEGFHFGELPVERWEFGYVIAVHSNGEMGHLPLFVWCLSFSSGTGSCPRKVSFLSYVNDEEEYLCKESGFHF